MKKILTSRQMKSVDDLTINELGLPAEVLMERAALSVADEINARHLGGKVLVVCGSGNNGADGICLARILFDRRFDVTLSLIGNEEKATGQYLLHKSVISKWGINFYNIIPEDEYDVIADTIFGIGLSRNVEGKYAQAINKINNLKEKYGSDVYSVDIPSGISADTGNILGVAVRADYTVTFGYMKVGQMLYPGREMCGNLICRDTGFANANILRGKRLDDCPYNELAFTYDEDDIGSVLPVRNDDSNKGSYGKLLIIAGSKNMAGAAVMCAGAAIRAGAGLVKIYTSESNRIIVQTAVPEAILSTYDETEDYREGDLLRELSWASMVVAGPGLSTDERAVKMVRTVCKHATCKLVCDADALNIVSEHGDIEFPAGTIITPHLKEMSRLVNKGVSNIKEDIIACALNYAKEHAVVIVLKDAKTIVSDGKKVYINSTGNNGLATGGSGDVLSGIIASFVAQGKEIYEGACAGVFVHGYVADMYRKRHNVFSLSPGDIVEGLKFI